MALTTGESNAINSILRWASGVNPHGQPEPALEDVAGDLELLLRASNKKLMAGFTSNQAEGLVKAIAARLRPKAERVTTVTVEPDNRTGDPIRTHVVRDEPAAYRKLREVYSEVAELPDGQIKEALADRDVYVQIEEHDLP